MKFHLHVGVVETADATTLDEALAIAGVAANVLARPVPNLALLEREDAEKVITALEERGLHPKVTR